MRNALNTESERNILNCAHWNTTSKLYVTIDDTKFYTSQFAGTLNRGRSSAFEFIICMMSF